MSTMIDSTASEVASRPSKTEPRGLSMAVAVLTILVVAMGAWIIYDFSRGAATAPTAVMSQVIDDYTDSWNDYDSEAFLAITAPGYKFTSAGGSEFDQADQAFEIANTLPRFKWQVEYIGESTVTGDGPWFVSMPIRTTTSLREAEGISILTLVDVDGILKVSGHRVVGDF